MFSALRLSDCCHLKGKYLDTMRLRASDSAVRGRYAGREPSEDAVEATLENDTVGVDACLDGGCGIVEALALAATDGPVTSGGLNGPTLWFSEASGAGLLVVDGFVARAVSGASDESSASYSSGSTESILDPSGHERELPCVAGSSFMSSESARADSSASPSSMSNDGSCARSRSGAEVFDVSADVVSKRCAWLLCVRF
jgi:hypothetical protein